MTLKQFAVLQSLFLCRTDCKYALTACECDIVQIHFVHYNKKYHDLSEALGHDDGIAVLGIFAQVTSP